ncbi:MAG: FAD-dependent oxidoreductase [Proteobacteria bacterium]|nr:FAD-dependent oxidoreductase [Pseudomonadota bacterium]MBU4119156.1 FAD-dependent oxidoreductase [Pseudomonadota bacterium]
MLKKVLVLGGSFGGLTAALEVKRRLGERIDVTVISKEDRFVFLPSLPWLVTGHRQAAALTLPLSTILASRKIHFVHGTACGIDPARMQVTTETQSHDYDYLVIATGPHLACEEIPGLGPKQGHTHCIFTLEHAQKSREAWLNLLANPGPIVLGSTQMASCFGPYYELAFELDHELRRRRMRHKVPITYLTSESYLGHMGIDGLGPSRRFIEDEFAKRDIKAVVNQAVATVEPDNIHLTDNRKLPFKLALLAPPFKGVAGVAALGNPRGFIPVDSHYRHPQHANVYAVGVAVAMAPREPTPVPTGVPKTGYMTVQMAKAAAFNIAADCNNTTPLAVEDLNILCLLDMGGTGALMFAEPILPPRQRSLLKKGRWVPWAKAGLERYFLWKMRHGLSQLP